MDPEYDPSHKTSSITSTTSTNSWDTVPTLTASSVCDDEYPPMDEQSRMDDYSCPGGRPGLAIPFTDDAANHNQKSFSHFSDHSLTLSGETDSSIFLHQSHEITISHSTTTNKDATPPEAETEQLATGTSTTNSNNSNNIDDDDSGSTSGQFKPSILTEDEKRANHIASEQKRRNTIRTGFKELTEIIPTLKNINNSKSTILFKAVEYIRHLDKCNRGLRDKLKSLQVRLEIEGRIGGLIRGPHLSLRSHHGHYYNEHQSKRNRSNSQQQQLPHETLAALLLHQNQQKQLEMLQEQLRYQQELLAKYNISTTESSSPRNSYRHLSIDQRSSLSSSLLYSSLSIPADHPSLSTTSRQHPSAYSQFYSSSFGRNFQHRSSAPALVIPNTTDQQPSISPSLPSTGPLLGVSSFNILADDEFKNNPTTSSKLHP